MGILDTNKIVPLEKANSISASLGTIGLLGGEVIASGFQEALLVVTTTDGAKISVRGGKKGNGVYYPPLKVRSLYNLEKPLDYIATSGIYVVDLLSSDRICFENESAINGNVTIAYTLKQKSYSYNYLDLASKMGEEKIVVLGSKLAKCTSSNQASAMSVTNISKYRFFSVRVRTMKSPTEKGYELHSFIVQCDWTGYGKAEGESIDVGGILAPNAVLSANNTYAAVSSWQEVLSPQIILYIKCVDVVPTEENPVYFHVDLVGIR